MSIFPGSSIEDQNIFISLIPWRVMLPPIFIAMYFVFLEKLSDYNTRRKLKRMEQLEFKIDAYKILADDDNSILSNLIFEIKNNSSTMMSIDKMDLFVEIKGIKKGSKLASEYNLPSFKQDEYKDIFDKFILFKKFHIEGYNIKPYSSEYFTSKFVIDKDISFFEVHTELYSVPINNATIKNVKRFRTHFLVSEKLGSIVRVDGFNRNLEEEINA